MLGLLYETCVKPRTAAFDGEVSCGAGTNSREAVLDAERWTIVSDRCLPGTWLRCAAPGLGGGSLGGAGGDMRGRSATAPFSGLLGSNTPLSLRISPSES